VSNIPEQQSLFQKAAHINCMSGQKDTWSGEEAKKEYSPEPTTSPSCSSGDGGLNRRTGLDSDRAERAAGIPEEIKDNQYASERELLIDLENLGLNDRRIVLNHDGFPIWRDMPGNPHVEAVEEFIDRFDEWKKKGRPTTIKCTRAKVNVYVNASFNRPPNVKRCPDFAIYGPDRLQGNKIRKVRNGERMNPHVIIQFSWTSTLFANEKWAIDDMMSYAGMCE
jgi:hypothetical protein